MSEPVTPQRCRCGEEFRYTLVGVPFCPVCRRRARHHDDDRTPTTAFASERRLQRVTTGTSVTLDV